MDDNGITAMAEKGIVGVILPTTHFLLKLKDPPVRKMITEGREAYYIILTKIFEFNIFYNKIYIN